MKISALGDDICHLGEGPLWDHASRMFYWVDSLEPCLCRHDYATSKTRRWSLPGKTVGSLAIREQGGLILAMDQGFYSFYPDSGALELIAEPLAGHDGLRLNDGKVDPFGYFVSGAMNIDYTDNQNCAMYRLSPDFEVSEILDGFECFNGPCFSCDGERLYLTGRQEGVIEVFDYAKAGLPVNGRVLLESCNPDGATVDDEDYIWSAQWDDGCLLRISPDGEIDYRIDFPGQIVSSVMFGGPELDLLYVTTVGAEVHGARPSATSAGRTLVIEDSGFGGRPEPLFKG